MVYVLEYLNCVLHGFSVRLVPADVSIPGKNFYSDRHTQPLSDRYSYACGKIFAIKEFGFDDART
jgi:hypothetical protein